MGKCKSRGPTDADRWFESKAERFLGSIGVRECLHVADVGCHRGRYTIPVSRMVGSCGVVYAIDKNPDVLKKVRRACRTERRRNVRVVRADLTRSLPASPRRGSVDLVLMYDMLHRGYLPERRQRRRVLKNVYRIMKPGGALSCFPTHLKKYGLTFDEIVEEIAGAGFVLRAEACRRMVHDDNVVRGRVFDFQKPGTDR